MWARREGEAGFERAVNESDMICGGAPSVSHLHVICMLFLYIVSYRVFPSLALALEQIEDDEAWLGSTTGHTSNRIPAQTHSINPGERWGPYHKNILSVLYIPDIIVLHWFLFCSLPIWHPLHSSSWLLSLSYLCSASRSALCSLRANGLPNDALHSDPGP